MVFFSFFPFFFGGGLGLFFFWGGGVAPVLALFCYLLALFWPFCVGGAPFFGGALFRACVLGPLLFFWGRALFQFFFWGGGFFWPFY